MDGILAPGTRVLLRCHRHLDCRVSDFIGAGGQGEVYRLQIQDNHTKGEFALKWYYPSWATERQYQRLSRLIDGSPPSQRFLWPFDLAAISRQRSFGYVMPVRPARFTSCVKIMAGKASIKFEQLLLAALRLSDCFLRLHAQGSCYRDINFGNIFIDTLTGDVLVVDNDNVGEDGEEFTDIRGTARFMAPEIIRNEASPGTASDLYSLSVLLFYLLMMDHPLEGKQLPGMLDTADSIRLYGQNPLFIFDPEDHSNAPDPHHNRNALVYWPIYPELPRRLFTQAFTVGLRDPAQRVRESQWRDCMARLVDLLVPCDCGKDVFVSPAGGRTAPCWSCRRTAGGIPNLPRLVIDPEHDHRVVALYPGRQLFEHHLGYQRFEYRLARARVEPNPELRGVYGLRNLTGTTWTAWLDTGPVTVAPRRSLRISPGATVAFGPVFARFEG